MNNERMKEAFLFYTELNDKIIYVLKFILTFKSMYLFIIYVYYYYIL